MVYLVTFEFSFKTKCLKATLLSSHEFLLKVLSSIKMLHKLTHAMLSGALLKSTYNIL